MSHGLKPLGDSDITGVPQIFSTVSTVGICSFRQMSFLKAGMTCLSPRPWVGLWIRVEGDLRMYVMKRLQKEVNGSQEVRR